jgi:hypothetical protein
LAGSKPFAAPLLAPLQLGTVLDNFLMYRQFLGGSIGIFSASELVYTRVVRSSGAFTGKTGIFKLREEK